MKLHTERTYVEQMIQAFPHLETMQDQLRFGSRAEVSFTRLNHQERDFLLDLYQGAGPRMQGWVAQIAILHKVMQQDDSRYPADDLEALQSQIANRLDDIDEAIVSRCITMIRYHPPGSEDRRQIWQVISQQFSLQLDSDMIDQLVTLFPGATGRYIKGLTKLVAKFCQHKKLSPAIEEFKRCLIFRGMDCAHV